MVDPTSSRTTPTKDVTTILDEFWATAPSVFQYVDAGGGKDPTKEREELRTNCIVEICDHLTSLGPDERTRELEAILERLSDDEPPPRDGPSLPKHRYEHDLLRSYLPVVLGVLHQSTGSNEMGRILLDRLVDDDGDTPETSPVVRQWIVRVLLRVFFGKNPDLDQEILRRFREYLRAEDSAFTELVMISEAGKTRDSRATGLFMDKLDGPFRTIRIAAVSGLDRLGPSAENPQKCFDKLCDRLETLRSDTEREQHNGRAREDAPEEALERKTEELLAWDFLENDSAEPRVLIQAIASVGESGDVDVSGALELLREEAEQGDLEEDVDVAMAAVRALGRLGENAGAEQVANTLFHVILEGRRDVSNAAAESLRNIMDKGDGATESDTTDHSQAAGFLVSKGLLGDRPGRVAQAIRVVNGQDTAVDALRKELAKEGGRSDKARQLLQSLGGSGAFQALSQFMTAQEHLKEVMEQSRDRLDKTLDHGFTAANFIRKASSGVVSIGYMVVVVALAVGIVAGMTGLTELSKHLLGAGVAGLVTLLGATYVSPVKHTAESMENLIRTQTMALGFHHQVTYAQLLLSDMYLRGSLDSTNIGTVFEEIRTAMDSVRPLLGQGADEAEDEERGNSSR